MSEQKSTYVKGSLVSTVAHQNLLALRQRQADMYWREKAEEKRKAEEPKKKRRGPRGSYERKSKRQKEEEAYYEEQETQKVIYQLVTEFISTQKEFVDWEPGSGKPLPNHKSQKSFAEEAGIDPAHYKELEAGRVEMTLDDAVKIARANDIDLATLLLPDIENLEQSEYFDLEPIHPIHGRLRMYEWVLWIFGYRPLPGQNEPYFRNATALPKAYFYSVSGKQGREDEVIFNEQQRRMGSKVSAWSEVHPGKETKDLTDLDHPFINDPVQIAKSLSEGHKIIRATLTVAARMKMAFQTERPKNLKTGGKHFVESIGRIRNRIIYIVYTLRSLK